MPYDVKKINGKYQVSNEQTGHIFSRGTTKDKAFKQLHLLHGVDHGMTLKKRKHI